MRFDPDAFVAVDSRAARMVEKFGRGWAEVYRFEDRESPAALAAYGAFIAVLTEVTMQDESKPERVRPAVEFTIQCNFERAISDYDMEERA